MKSQENILLEMFSVTSTLELNECNILEDRI